MYKRKLKNLRADKIGSAVAVNSPDKIYFALTDLLDQILQVVFSSLSIG